MIINNKDRFTQIFFQFGILSSSIANNVIFSCIHCRNLVHTDQIVYNKNPHLSYATKNLPNYPPLYALYTCFLGL